MLNTNQNNKRIAKNTLLLYFRMLFSMVVSLYTSRVTLAALGVDDFGIYNVVGSVTASFSMLASGPLSNAASRFITFALGKNDERELKKMFSTIKLMFLLSSIVVFLILDSFGLWFLYNKMTIPLERLPIKPIKYRKTREPWSMLITSKIPTETQML